MTLAIAIIRARRPRRPAGGTQHPLVGRAQLLEVVADDGSSTFISVQTR